MNHEETAHYLVKKMSQYTTSVTKQITFENAKQCAVIAANEVLAQYELEHDAKLWIFWNNVIKSIAFMKLETK